MKTLMVLKAKPNPFGKDKTRSGYAPPDQLAGEWIDIKNFGAGGVELHGINLCHQAYKADGTWEWEVVCPLPTMILGVNEILRVHSGPGPLQLVRPEDATGAHWHSFTHRNYVWNNDHSDTPLLWLIADKVVIDQATYDPYPPEGVVLVRSGHRLVVGALVYRS